MTRRQRIAVAATLRRLEARARRAEHTALAALRHLDAGDLSGARRALGGGELDPDAYVARLYAVARARLDGHEGRDTPDA